MLPADCDTSRAAHRPCVRQSGSVLKKGFGDEQLKGEVTSASVRMSLWELEDRCWKKR